MARVALLIGTGSYSEAFKELPAAPKDVFALETVLSDPEMGGFEVVRTLINPQHTGMAETIETWFREHTADDLALLFISGHGIKDAQRELYFAASNTRKEREELVTSTAVAARFVHECSRRSRAKRQILILDCCFSGAFGDLLARDDGTIDLESTLLAEGRVVLTSSNSLQYSFEQRDGNLSIYTSYLVEGIQTGAADFDGDGSISIQELHQYASQRVQEASPNMSPKIIVLKDEGYRLRIAKAPLGDPKVKYRKEVGIIAEEDEGEISFINQEVLRERQQQLGLSSEEAQQIEFEVLEPYRQRKAKLARYRQVFTQAVQQNYSLTEKNNNALKRLQLTLNLREEDVRSIEAEILEESNLTSAKAVQRVEPIEPVIRSVPVQEVRHESEEFSEDDLGSERNVDYRPLQAFLKAGDWQRADIETAAIMQGIEGAGENLTAEEVLNLPCQDLATIDQLWTKYSGGKFSFSVQRRIYLGSGGTLMARSANSLKSEVWTKFSTQVGWFTSKKLIAYSDATFDISAPDGHFPFGIYMWGLKLWGGSTIFIDLGEVFFFRITQCRV